MSDHLRAVRCVAVALLLLLTHSLAVYAQAPALPAPGVVTANANLRAGPGTTYARVGGVKAGDAVQVSACSTGCTWYKLDSGQWIAASLVQLGEVLQNKDASPAVAEQAHLEAILVALLKGKQGEAVTLLQSRPLPTEGATREMLRCLVGEITPQLMEARIPGMPLRLRNDAHLVLAVRYRMDGDEERYVSELRRTLQDASPASDWPAPLARMLLNEFRG